MSAQTELKNIMALYNDRFPDAEKASIIEEETEKGYNLTFRINDARKYTIHLTTDQEKKYMTSKKLFGFKQTGYTALLGMLAERFVLGTDNHSVNFLTTSVVPINIFNTKSK